MTPVRDLKVWQKAHEMTLKIYSATSSFPPEEKFGLTSQLRRAAVSVEANLAEGSKKVSQADFARFVNIAEGSAGEIDILLKISLDLRFLPGPSHQELSDACVEVQKMLWGFRKKLELAD